MSELESARWPEFVMFRSLPIRHRDYRVINASLDLGGKPLPAGHAKQFEFSEQVFSVVRGPERLTINDVVEQSGVLGPATSHLPDGDHAIEITIEPEKQGPRLQLAGIDIVALVLNLQLRLTTYEVEPVAIEYRDLAEGMRTPVMIKAHADLPSGQLDVCMTFEFDKETREFTARTDIIRQPPGGTFEHKLIFALVPEQPH